MPFAHLDVEELPQLAVPANPQLQWRWDSIRDDNIQRDSLHADLLFNIAASFLSVSVEMIPPKKYLMGDWMRGR